MKITNVSARNFKGLTFNEDLAAGTVFIGRNFAGKSARADAVRLALLGHLPELGKRNQDTFRLATGRDMEVAVTFDTGATIRRRFYAHGAGVKTEETIPDEFKDVPTLAVMLDASQYFALTDQGRVDYIFTNLDLAGAYDHEKITGELAETLRHADYLGDTEETRAAIDRLISEINEAAADADKTAGADPDVFMSPQNFVALARKTVDARATANKKFASVMSGTAQGVTALKHADGTEPAFEKPELEKKLAAVGETVTRLTARKGELAAIADAYTRSRNRRAEIERELIGAPETEEELKKHTDALAAVESRITELGDADARLSAAEREEAGALADNRAILAEISRHTAAVEKLEKELAGLDEKKECPFCGASGDGWKELRRAGIITELATARQVLTDTKTKNEHEIDRRHTLAEKISILKIEAGELRDIRFNRDRMKRKVEEVRLKLERLKALREQLASMGAEPVNPGGDLQAVTDELNIAAQDYRALEANRRELDAREHDARRAAQAELEHKRAVADYEAAKEAGKILKAIQSRMVEESFAPLLNAANTFFGSVLHTGIAYHDGEIGTWRGGTFVSHHTFSGTEKALTYAAIAIALAGKCPVKLMVIDELGRLDDFSLEIVLTALKQATSTGRLDQFIGIDAGRGNFYAQHADSSFLVRDLAK